ERDIAAFAAAHAFPILPCNLCGSQDNLWLQQVEELLDGLEERIPRVRESLGASLTNVRPTHLMDASLLRALGLPSAPAPAGSPLDADLPEPRFAGRRLPMVL